MDYYSTASCGNFLRDFLEELHDYYPRLHKFVVQNIFVHPGSGKRVIGSREDITVASSPSAATPGFATPRRRTAPSDTDAPPVLSNAEEKLYYYAPQLFAETDAHLASLIVLAQLVKTAVAELHRRRQRACDAPASGHACARCGGQLPGEPGVATAYWEVTGVLYRGGGYGRIFTPLERLC